MTFRERLADLLTGGALTTARDDRDRLASELRTSEHLSDTNRRQIRIHFENNIQFSRALRAIADATENGKSGTAKRINLMAKKGLE